MKKLQVNFVAKKNVKVDADGDYDFRSEVMEYFREFCAKGFKQGDCPSKTVNEKLVFGSDGSCVGIYFHFSAHKGIFTSSWDDVEPYAYIAVYADRKNGRRVPADVYNRLKTVIKMGAEEWNQTYLDSQRPSAEKMFKGAWQIYDKAKTYYDAMVRDVRANEAKIKEILDSAASPADMQKIDIEAKKFVSKALPEAKKFLALFEGGLGKNDPKVVAWRNICENMKNL